MSIISQYTGMNNEEFNESIKDYQEQVYSAKETYLSDLKGVKNLEVFNITLYRFMRYNLGVNGFFLTDGKKIYGIIDVPQNMTLKSYKSDLYKWLKENGVFVKGLFDSITIRR